MTSIARHIYEKLRIARAIYIRLDLANKSAGLAFYTIISVFPMILLLVTILGSILPTQILIDDTRRMVTEFLPYQSPLIMTNLESLLKHRGTFSWFGGITLFFSASMLYVNLAKVVNELMDAQARRYLQNRFFFLLWLAGVVFVLFVPFFLHVAQQSLAFLGIQSHWMIWAHSRGGFVVTAFLMFLLVVVIMPTRRIKFSRVLGGATIFAVSLEIGKLLFQWFSARSFHKYNLIYGSLGSLVLGALWIFYFYHMFLTLVYWTGHRIPAVASSDTDPQ